MLTSGPYRIATYWNDLVAERLETDCDLSGPGTFGALVSYKIQNQNDPHVDGLVHGGSAPGATTFRSAYSFTVSFFGLRLYSAPKTTASCNQRVHAQITVARSADDSTGNSTTFVVMQYKAVQPELLGTAVRAGITTTADRLQIWPSLDADNFTVSQQLGGSGNSGAPGRWVFRVDGRQIRYGLPHPNFVPAEANVANVTASATLLLTLQLAAE